MTLDDFGSFTPLSSCSISPGPSFDGGHNASSLFGVAGFAALQISSFRSQNFTTVKHQLEICYTGPHKSPVWEYVLSFPKIKDHKSKHTRKKQLPSHLKPSSIQTVRVLEILEIPRGIWMILMVKFEGLCNPLQSMNYI